MIQGQAHVQQDGKTAVFEKSFIVQFKAVHVVECYSDTVPGGASGYSGPSGYSRSSYGGGYGSGYSANNRSGYLNREYNAGESRGFGSSYGGRSTASSGFGSNYGTAPPSRPQEAADLAPHIPAEMRRKTL